MRQLLSQIKHPLARTLRLLRPHWKEVRTAWEKKLRSLGVKDEEIKALAPLTLEGQSGELEAGDFDAYLRELGEQAKLLEGKGLTEAHVAVALTSYLECCLPFLLQAGASGRDPALALSQLVVAEQFLLLSGYGEHRTASLRRLQDRERLTLSRDLHDEIGHNLLVLKLYLEMMAMDLKKGNVAELQSKLEEALALVQYAVDSVRRLMLDLGPGMLSQFGFLPALRIYARQFSLRTGIEVRVEESDLPAELPSTYETALYRVLQGTLSNALQHSRGKHVKVSVGCIRKSVIVMVIEDDGIGFDTHRIMPSKAFGLGAVRERVEMLGGKFHIESWLAGPGKRRHGTRIEVDLPLPASEKGAPRA